MTMIPGIRLDTREVSANDGASFDSGTRTKQGVIECRLGMQNTGAAKRDRAIRAIKIPPRPPFGGGMLTVTNDPPDPNPPDDPENPWEPPNSLDPVIFCDPPPFNPVRIPNISPGVSGICEVNETSRGSTTTSSLNLGKSGYNGVFTVAWRDLTPKEFRLFQVAKGKKKTPLLFLEYNPKNMILSTPLADPEAIECTDYTRAFGPIVTLESESQIKADMIDTSGRSWPLLVTLNKMTVPVMTVPVIAVGDPPPVIYNTPYTYTPDATGTVTSWSATGLPSGLSINASTGVISGTYTGSTYEATVVVTATNASGSDSATFQMIAGGEDFVGAGQMSSINGYFAEEFREGWPSSYAQAPSVAGVSLLVNNGIFWHPRHGVFNGTASTISCRPIFRLDGIDNFGHEETITFYFEIWNEVTTIIDHFDITSTIVGETTCETSPGLIVLHPGWSVVCGIPMLSGDPLYAYFPNEMYRGVRLKQDLI